MTSSHANGLSANSAPVEYSKIVLPKGMLLALAIFTYMLLTPPFVFGGLIEQNAGFLRLGLEGMVLLWLAGIAASGLRSNLLLFLVLGTAIVILNSMAQVAEMRTNVSHFNKFLFAILFSNALQKHEGLREACARILVAFMFYSTVSAMVALVSTLFEVPTFIYLDRAFDLGYGYHSYYHHPLFGNYLQKTVHLGMGKTISLPRVTGWASEPGQLSLLFAFCMAGAKDLGHTHRQQKRIFAMALVGGLLTLSVTFGLSLLALAALWILERMKNRGRTIPFLCGSMAVCTVLIIGVLGLSEDHLLKLSDQWTSVGDRATRLRGAISLWKRSDLFALLFGQGIGSIVQSTGMGASSGLVNLIVEKGLCYTFFLLSLAKVCGKRRAILVVSIVYMCVVDYWSWPIFWICLCVIEGIAVSKSRRAEFYGMNAGRSKQAPFAAVVQ